MRAPANPASQALMIARFAKDSRRLSGICVLFGATPTV